MKKIFLMAYVRKNLGDDLFIKMLTEKYPMFEFFLRVNTDAYIDNLINISNLKISVEDNLREKLYNSNVTDFDAYVYIGGSIFIEPEDGKLYYDNFDQFIEKCMKNNIPFYYISCNFGPYKTQEYLNYSKRIFNNCTDICFRDKYSYNLFKDIPSVRYAPDYIFNYPDTQNTKIENSVGISVIDLSFRTALKDKQDTYINILINNIQKYIDFGKKVYLFSFCKYEGDEKTIDTILDHFSDTTNIFDIRYNGNIDEFLKIYNKMDYMICTRFHSFILSSIFKQKIYIMSYSSKIDNVLSDLDFDLPIIHIQELKDEQFLKLDDFKIAKNECLEKTIYESKNQENGFKKLLKKRTS